MNKRRNIVSAGREFIQVEKNSPSPTKESEEVMEDVPDWLSRGLRELYNEVLNEPVPDDFKSLLEELDKKSEK